MLWSDKRALKEIVESNSHNVKLEYLTRTTVNLISFLYDLFSYSLFKTFCLLFQLQDTETTSGESEVKFQVSRDTLGAMLRSMAYIRKQLSNAVR